MKAPEVPVSWGELLDKITILEIKSARLKNPAAVANVTKELNLLASKASEVLKSDDVRILKERLAKINATLWQIEDDIREKEAKQEFDVDFVALARSVYQQNDERAAIKRQINDNLSSDIIEEKSYRSY